MSRINETVYLVKLFNRRTGEATEFSVFGGIQKEERNLIRFN